MEISAFSPASIWNNATRTLTSFGSNTEQLISFVNSSLAANATLDMRTTATSMNFMTIAASADASGTVVFQFTDNTNIWPAVTIAAGTIGGTPLITNASNPGVVIKNNSATVAAKVWASGVAWQQ